MVIASCLNIYLSVAVIVFSFLSLGSDCNSNEFCQDRINDGWNRFGKWNDVFALSIIIGLWIALILISAVNVESLIVASRVKGRVPAGSLELTVESIIVNLFAVAWFVVPMVLNRVMMAVKLFKEAKEGLC